MGKRTQAPKEPQFLDSALDDALNEHPEQDASSDAQDAPEGSDVITEGETPHADTEGQHDLTAAAQSAPTVEQLLALNEQLNTKYQALASWEEQLRNGAAVQQQKENSLNELFARTAALEDALKGQIMNSGAPFVNPHIEMTKKDPNYITPIGIRNDAQITYPELTIIPAYSGTYYHGPLQFSVEKGARCKVHAQLAKDLAAINEAVIV